MNNFLFFLQVEETHGRTLAPNENILVFNVKTQPTMKVVCLPADGADAVLNLTEMTAVERLEETH